MVLQFDLAYNAAYVGFLGDATNAKALVVVIVLADDLSNPKAGLKRGASLPLGQATVLAHPLRD
jgi:hypothetical protein